MFPFTRPSTDDVILDAVIRFPLWVNVTTGAARNGQVSVSYRVDNATGRDFQRRFSRRRNPLRSQMCLHIRVLDAVVGLRRGSERRLTTFVGLSASLVQRQRQRRPRRPRRNSLAEEIGISVLRQPFDPFFRPFLTIYKRERTCNSDGRDNIRLWQLP